MFSFRTSCILTTCLATQLSQPSPEISNIQQYVNAVAANTTLTISLIGYHISPKVKSFKYAAVQDTLFYTYGTDFPCTATLYYLNHRLVRVKEVINVGSGFTVNQYYLKDNKLVFTEAKDIICPFQKQSLKIKCSEKEYIFSGKYFFVNDSCIYIKEKGESRYGYGRVPVPPKKLVKPRIYFYYWQAARYVTLFSHPPKRH